MKIAVAGTGYVGLSISVLLAQHNEVWAVDILPEKVALLAARKSPIADKEIEQYLAEKELDLHPTTDAAAAYTGADIIVVSTPTNYDPDQNYFDTSSVESVIRQVMAVNPSAAVVIRSTVPVGFTESARIKHGCRRLLFSPEFLREGRAQNAEEALAVVKADLKALNADVQVSQEEYDEVVAIKPMFLVSDYE